MNGNTSNDGLDATLANTMTDLVVMALACDLTRVFTFMLTKPAAHVVYGAVVAAVYAAERRAPPRRARVQPPAPVRP